MTETPDNDGSTPTPAGADGAIGLTSAVTAQVTADVSAEWSWAASAARIPQVTNLIVELSKAVPAARLTVTLREHDVELGSVVAFEGQMQAGRSSVDSARVPLSARYMAQVEERRGVECVIDLSVAAGDGSEPRVLARCSEAVDLHPRDLWFWDGDPGRAARIRRLEQRGHEISMLLEGTGDEDRRALLEEELDGLARQHRYLNESAHLLARSLLSSFVRPNHPEVALLAREAATRRGQVTGSPQFSAYQQEDPEVAATEAEASVTAVYEALSARDIAYSEPPPGWDYSRTGQRIRDHGDVARGGLGTCMDTTVLMAAVLEHIGLHPLLVLVQGHIFIGYWRRDPFPGARTPEWYPDAPVVLDPHAVSSLVDGRFLGLIETTTLTTGKSVSAAEARETAAWTLRTKLAQGEFRALIDVAGARRSGVSPLPAVHERADGVTEVVEYRAGGQPEVTTVETAPADSSPHSRIVDDHPPRYRTWKASLLSLSAGSALLNLGSGPGVQPIVLPAGGLGVLEDRLHQDVEFQLLNGFELPEIYRAQEKPNAVLLDGDEQLELLRQRKLYVQRMSSTKSSPGPVTPAKCLSELKSMARRAKEAQDERGMNPLFLCLGVLRWPHKPGSMADAPLILVPVHITMRRGSKELGLSLDTASHTTPNTALIEWLRREHNLQIPALAEPVADKAGIDVDEVLATVRREVAARGLPFDVASEAKLALLDLSAFRMWQDLNLHGDTFLHSPLVHHLVHTPTEPFPAPEVEGRVADDELEETLEELETPIPADAAQKTAVVWAREGRNFVLQGPPGTGKSQTITNMVAECVAQGMKVLFVAEKGTALAVVQRRLDAIGLGPFTLNLHHEGSSAAEVRAQLKESLSARVSPDKAALENARRRLRNTRFELGRYPQELHRTNAAGLSAYSAYDELLVLGDGPELDVSAELVAHEGERIDQIRALLRDLPPWTAAAGVRSAHPWRLAGPVPEEDLDLDGVGGAVRAILDLQAWVDGSLGAVRAALEEVTHPRQLAGLAAAADPLLPSGAELDELLDPAWPDQAAAVLGECERSVEGWRSHLNGFDPAVLELDLTGIARRLEEAASSGLFGKKARRLAAVEPLAAHCSAGTQLEPARCVEILERLLKVQQAGQDILRSVVSVPGLSVPHDWNAFGEGAFDLPRRRLDELVDATAALRGNTETHGRLRELAVSGSLRTHHDRLCEYAGSWRDLMDRLAVRDQDLEAWRADESLTAATRANLHTWRSQLTHERLLPLQRWVALVDRLEVLLEAGLRSTHDDILEGRMPAYLAEEAFARGVARASLRERIRSSGFDHFDAMAHDQRVRGYAESESEVRELWRTATPAELLDRRGGGGRGAHTGGLARELEKTRGRLGTRALLRKHGSAVQELSPVVLASPSSAVDLIEPGVMEFDLAIFDEASQITVPEAVGAMGRARAVVVVGDTRQMPPSRKVGADSAVEEEIDDPDVEEMVEDQESILSECELARVPTLQLSWHYRSQDEALIAFSNTAYYGGGLSSFPTPTLLSTETGVELRRVQGHFIRAGGESVVLADGVVAGRNTNPAEARAIVDTVLELIDSTPDARPSIGVVTFNEQQRLLVDELLRATPDHRLARIMDESVMGPTEVLFVKALEQVQGDERDVVLFSVAFSKQANGKIPLNFGRLSNSGGERRLNVAVTRARRKNVVFCSFEPEELEAEKSSYLGVKDLKRFLMFARSAGRAQDDRATVTAERPVVRDRHRDEIAAVLREAGLHVMTDVGLSDFRLDLVLARPERPERIVLPILLDGESWRGRRTVSDRDVLPVEVLTNLMGWPAVARIWWPMWLQNRQQVIDAVLEEFARAESVREGGKDTAESARKSIEPLPPEAQSDDPTSSYASENDVPVPAARSTSKVTTDDSLLSSDVPPSAPPAGGVPEAHPSTRASASSAEWASAGDGPIADLDRYVRWSGTGLPPADSANPEVLMDTLEKIVRTEGPMHAELAYRRYVEASGGKRLGPAVKRTLNQSTARLVRSGRLAQIEDGLPGQITKTLYLPGDLDVRVRELGERTLQDVPRSEVLALISRLNLSPEDDGAKRAALAAYGRVQLTGAADAYLQSCLNYDGVVTSTTAPDDVSGRTVNATSEQLIDGFESIDGDESANDVIAMEDVVESMRRAMSAESGDGWEFDTGYVQWVGFEGGGLHVEASDGGDYATAMDAGMVDALCRAGWGRPDDELRNCWFQISDERELEAAAELVFAALEVLLDDR